ncbi:hypothetical protein PoB_005877300 [Plakobranchus ocellatus]|uniref:Uncharacterized protein n=1 Tax=Plakobranchus ocellatus TaxID=259542 RepID=A0AAV4CKS3_9GAST|nr:hypothetical protein PoB_005877300 [Plakobranchus ocellatus]
MNALQCVAGGKSREYSRPPRCDPNSNIFVVSAPMAWRREAAQTEPGSSSSLFLLINIHCSPLFCSVSERKPSRTDRQGQLDYCRLLDYYSPGTALPVEHAASACHHRADDKLRLKVMGTPLGRFTIRFTVSPQGYVGPPPSDE